MTVDNPRPRTSALRLLRTPAAGPIVTIATNSAFLPDPVRIGLLVFLAAVLSGVMTAASAPARAAGKSLPQAFAPACLRASGRSFLDPAGRVVVLRGINLSGDSKVPPFLPCTSPSDLDRLQALGMNVVRLLFIWEAYEPEPGRYDESYLAAVRSVAAEAWARGMYVIVDIHQDGFSRHCSKGSGDGFPRWAVSYRTSTPDNSSRCKNWPMMMATDRATHRSFNDFFTDATGVRTRYLALLARIAVTFAATPGVIGYDLMNEPWGDEPNKLAPLYHDAACAIRAGHPTAILFLEGHVTTNSGLQTKLPRPAFDNYAYAPHYYKPTTVVLGRWQGACHSIDRAFGNMTGKAGEWDCPLFLGEFGAGAGVKNGGDYTAALYDRLDLALASGAQWNYTPNWTEHAKDGWNGEDFNILGPDGSPRPNFRPRPYPRHTAGLPLGFAYQDSASPGGGRSLEFVWEHHPERGETEIFVPRALFPPGSIATTQTPGVTCLYDEARQLLVCRAPTAGVVRVRLTSG